MRIIDLTPRLAQLQDLMILDCEHVLRYVYDERDDFIGADLLTHPSDVAAYLSPTQLLGTRRRTSRTGGQRIRSTTAHHKPRWGYPFNRTRL